MDPVFLTLYLPKQDVREYELATDAACAAFLRTSIVDKGTKLEDRRGTSGPPTTGPTDDPWSDLDL